MKYGNVDVGEKFLPADAVEALEKPITKWGEFLVDSCLTSKEVCCSLCS